MSTPVVPLLQSLLVADHVYLDQRTGKAIICGVFHVIYCHEPQKQEEKAEIAAAPEDESTRGRRELARRVKVGSPYAYVAITDLKGARQFELRFVDLADQDVLFSFGFTMESNDPLAVREVVVQLPELRLSSINGVYALELLCEDEWLGSHRIQAKSVETRRGEA